MNINSSNKVINLEYVPRKAFVAFHARTKRFSVLVCHRRAGKTVCTVNDLVVRALNTIKKDAFYAYVCPTLTQAKQVAWKILKGAVAPLSHAVKINETECSVVLPNGSTVRLFGADNPDSLRGLYFDGIVLDEFGDMKGRVYTEVIRPALADRKGWVVFIGTPRGKNEFYKKREQARTNQSEKWFYMELKASESGILDPAELEDMKQDMDEDEIAAELECSFDAAIKGSYFGKWIQQIAAENQITHVPCIPGLPVHTAWDLGRTDATSIWFYQIYAGQVRIIDFYENAQMDIDEIYEDVIAFGYNLGKVWLPQDSKAKRIGEKKSVIERLLAEGMDCDLVTDYGVKDGIDNARRMLKHCYFDANKCNVGVERLKSYQREWNPELQVFANTPKHDINSHAADAFRYLCIALKDTDIHPQMEAMRKKRPTELTEKELKEKKAVNMNITYSELTLDEMFAEHDRDQPIYLRI